MRGQCNNCETEGARPSRFGDLLCEGCIKQLEELEVERKKEETEQIKRAVEGRYFEPSLAFILWADRLKRAASPVLSEIKIPDYVSTNVLPIVALMSDEEVVRAFILIKEHYFHLQSTLKMREVERFREAEIIKCTTKRIKTREKATTEIARQKKYASKDRTLSKGERAKAKVIEGLAMALGCSLDVAEEQYKKLQIK